jgi:hypothetical protein
MFCFPAGGGQPLLSREAKQKFISIFAAFAAEWCLLCNIKIEMLCGRATKGRPYSEQLRSMHFVGATFGRRLFSHIYLFSNCIKV